MHFIHALLLTTLVATPLVGMANTCDTGRLQSPINITASQKQKLPSLVFDYKNTPLVLANDGHTLRIRINNHSQLKVGKQIYALSQVHFHTPAGDQIAGEVFPMGAHFLHKSTNGQLLALVVLFRLGEPNKTINTLLANIPKQVGPNQAIENTSIDIYGLLPTDKAYTLRIRINNHSQLKVGKQIYALSQVHFHTPAGDQIAGEVFPMGAHFLHKSTNGQLLALVVLFRLGEPNKTINTLLANIPKQVGPNQAIENTSIDIHGLLPTDKAYYRYIGSLTASPCTEGVEWIILKEPITVSAEQLTAYKKVFPNNARAPQPINQRPILESI